MPGNTPRLSPLESHKKLVILESELNRAELARDLAALAGEARQLGDRARSLGSLASATAVLVAGLIAWRRGRSPKATAKQSKLQTVIASASLLSAFWLAFHSPGREQKGESNDARRGRAEAG